MGETRLRDYWESPRWRIIGANGMLSASGLLTGPILARVLGPSDRGVLAYLVAATFLFSILATMGFEDAATLTIAEGKVSVGQLLRRSLLLATPVSVLSAAGAVAFLPGQFDAHRSIVAGLLFVGILFGALSLIVEGAVTGTRHLEPIVVRRAANGAFRVVVVLALLVAGRLSIVTAFVVQVAVVSSGVLLLPALRSVGAGSRDGARELGRLATRIIPTLFGSLALTRVDQLLLPHVAPVSQLGYYAVAVTVAEVPQFLSGATRQHLLSQLTGTPASELPSPTTIFRQQMGPTVALSALLLVCSPFVIPLAFGEPFRPAVPAAVVLCLAQVFLVATNVFDAVLVSLRHVGLSARTQWIGLVVNVVAIVVLGHIGALGAALAALIGYGAATVAGMRYVARIRGPEPASA
jgi:O-antigen/teichoic acid export membrane protein